MVMLMNELKESELIVAEIKKTESLYDDMKKYIIIKINYDKDADEKSFEFQGFFNDGIESIESTAKLTTKCYLKTSNNNLRGFKHHILQYLVFIEMISMFHG